MSNNTFIDNLVVKLETLGCIKVTIQDLEIMVNEVGYKFLRSMDCRALAKDMNSGERYPNLTLYPIQIDDKKSAWHFEARRDQNFEQLKAIRSKYFAVTEKNGVKTFVDF